MSTRIFLLICGLGISVASAWAEPTARTNYQGELGERAADSIALESQIRAIEKTERLLAKVAASEEAPTLLLLCAENQSRAAALLSRMAYGDRAQSSARITQKNQALHKAIQHLSRILVRKDAATLSQSLPALFLRAKTFEELEDQKSAEADYRNIIRTFPTSEESRAARLAVAELAAQRKDYDEVLALLKPLRDDDQDSRHSLALYRSAWAYFNLDQFHSALQMVHTHTVLLNKAQGGSSDAAIRDALLLDAAVFFAEGLEKKDSCCTVEKAFGTFESLAGADMAPRLHLRFAKILRSHLRDSELKELAHLLVKRFPKRTETQEIAILRLEHAWNRKNIDELSRSVEFLPALRTISAGIDAGLLVRFSQIVEALNQAILSNEKAEGVRELLSTQSELAGIYLACLDLQDERRYKTHLLLGETDFRIGKFEAATHHYRSALSSADASQWKPADQDAAVRSISARASELRARKILNSTPELKLDRSALAQVQDGKELPKIMSEWLSWLDESPDAVAGQLELFRFEAIQSLVLLGQSELARSRALEFSLRFPSMKSAALAASLALDIDAVRQNWAALETDSKRLLKSELAKSREFVGVLENALGEALFQKMKLLLQKREITQARSEGERLLNRLPQHPRRSEALAILAQTFEAENNADRALASWKRLATEEGGTPAEGLARRALATEAFARFDFHEAAKQEIAFARWSSRHSREHFSAALLRAIELASVSGEDSQAMAELRKSPNFCGKADGSQMRPAACVFLGVLTPSELEKYSQDETLPPGIKAMIVAHTGTGSDGQGALQKIATIYAGIHDLPETLLWSQRTRMEASLREGTQIHLGWIREKRRLEADEWAIKRRVKAIQNAEGVIDAALKAPLPGLATIALTWVSNLYRDAAEDLRAIRIPRGLQGAERAAFSQMIEKIAAPFDTRASEIAAKAKPTTEHPPAVSATVAPPTKTQWPVAWKKAWDEAASRNQLPKLVLLIREAEKNKLLADADLQAFRSTLLKTAGGSHHEI